MKAKLIYKNKLINGLEITELTVWKVPATTDKPHGFKYSLVYIVDGNRIVGYDNGERKGDHRHINGIEYSYRFIDIKTLFADFFKDVRRFKNERNN